jgi:hypothetical protein
MIEYVVKVDSDGNRMWYLNGHLHREDGPAVECANGDRYWFLNGKIHRDDGPAIELANGSRNWYLNGKSFTEAEFKERMNPAKELTIAEIEQLLGHKVKVVK